MTGRLRRLFRGPVETGLVVGIVYLLLAAGTATVERMRALHKIGQGGFTDTSQPLGVSRALTWPVHNAVADSWPGYPAQFDAAVYRALVNHAWSQTIGAALLEACLIALIVGALGMVFRSLRSSA